MKNILILAGPSAVGKTTLAHTLLKRDGRFELVRSVTSRTPRGDSFDEEYIYITKEEFDNLIDAGGVLEYTEYAGNFYGTPRSEIDRICAEGKVPLLILDLNGVASVVSGAADVSPCAVYIYAPEEVLDMRLKERYGADTEKLESRVTQNRTDHQRFLSVRDNFFAITENTGNVEESAGEIQKIFDRFQSLHS